MRGLILFTALMLVGTAPSLAKTNPDRASFGNDIVVSEGEAVDNVACAFCSIHVHGNVKGNVAVLFGDVTLDDSQAVSGNVAILGGDLTLRDDARVGGNVAIAAGHVALGSDATIDGSRAIFPSRLWVLVPFTPLLILIGIIWLVVYIVRRNRYRYPAYPNGRGV